MPYKKKEARKDYMRDYRKRKPTVNPSDKPSRGLECQTVPGSSPAKPYPPIVYALSDIDKRAKLRQICISLREHHVLKDVHYGIRGTPFDIVAELLEAFD